MTEVSEDRFKDFKEEMIRVIDSLKGAIDLLSGKIDAFTCVTQGQAQDIAVLKTKMDEVDKLKDKVEKQEIQLVESRTENKIKQRNLAIYFTLASLLIGTISICIALFK